MSEQVIDQNPTETASFDPFADHTYEQVGEPTLGQPHKRRRTSRVDTVLAQAKDVALAGIEQIAPKNTIGLLHHLRGEEDRLTTHLFECTLPGYRGWFWFATLARAPRSKVATVCEVGLLPGDDALLAPDWVPWAQRLQELPDTADLDEALAADPEDVYEDEEPQFDAATEPPETGGKSRKARRSARKAQNAQKPPPHVTLRARLRGDTGPPGVPGGTFASGDAPRNPWRNTLKRYIIVTQKSIITKARFS